MAKYIQTPGKLPDKREPGGVNHIYLAFAFQISSVCKLVGQLGELVSSDTVLIGIGFCDYISVSVTYWIL